MLTEKQLQALVGCGEKEDCTGETCPMFETCDNDYTNKVAAEAAQTALAYREMLERARKTLQDAWDDDGSAVIGNQILETINAIDALLGGEKDA